MGGAWWCEVCGASVRPNVLVVWVGAIRLRTVPEVVLQRSLCRGLPGPDDRRGAG